MTGTSFGARLREVALSHHLPHEHDRCTRVGSKLVCRRCLVLYPVAFTVMFAALAGMTWSTRFDPFLLLILPFAATIDYVIERLGAVTYHGGRQQLVTLVAAPALGTGLARHIRSPFSSWFVTMVLVHGGLCALAHVIASSRETQAVRVTHAQDIVNDPVMSGFTSAEAFRAYLDDVASRSPAR